MKCQTHTGPQQNGVVALHAGQNAFTPGLLKQLSANRVHRLHEVKDVWEVPGRPGAVGISRTTHFPEYYISVKGPEERMPAIFISYRRDDAEGEAGRLFDDLTAKFGADSIFMDVMDIKPGRDFRKVIDENVSSCGVLLAMIGKGWINATDEAGRRRLDDPQDFVRLETVSALKRDIPVIPVLVHGASMPLAEQLPEELKELAYRKAVELTHARWESDIEPIVSAWKGVPESRKPQTGRPRLCAVISPGPNQLGG